MNDYFDEIVVRVTNLGVERQRNLEHESKPKKKKKRKCNSGKIKSNINYNGKKHSKSGLLKCIHQHKPIDASTASGKSNFFQ